MAGDGVACLCCCRIPNGVARRNEALRTNYGYNATINLVTRDDNADKTAKARAAAGRRWSVGSIRRRRWRRRRRRRQARADADRQGMRAGAMTTACKGALTASEGGHRQDRDESRRDDEGGRRGRMPTGQGQEPARRRRRQARADANGPGTRAGATTTAAGEGGRRRARDESRRGGEQRRQRR
jgi:hypothetical protein